MTRIARYRLGYGAALVALAGVVALVLAWMGTSPAVLIGLGLLLMVPGRVQGVLFRDLFAGTRLLRAARAAAAIPVLERFLAAIRARPRRKRAMWLSWPGWSADVQAVALTNLGAARREEGDLAGAERDLRAALARDPQRAPAWANLAAVHVRRGEPAGAALGEARRLGLRGGALDAIQAALAGQLAPVEGR